MNIAPLFKRFDELADAPERISALRKVILAYLLHSAVNSPDAISRAATLRAAHETRRRELIESATRKEVATVPVVVDEDLPPSLSDIPAVLFDRLGNIASIEKGLSQIQSTTPGKYPLVVTAETRSSSESFDFEGAAAIIPLVSSTGHGDASLKRLHYQEGRYAVGNILAVVKPICPDLLRARFIYEYLSAFKEELLVSRMVGTANVSLTVNKLKEVPVPLVSGPVLSRIDELMAMCDRLALQQQERETRHAALARASLARFADAPTPANLNLIFHPSYSVAPADLRKSILTLAVQGKLVPQDPNDEPAEELLKRNLTERRKLKRTEAMEVGPLSAEDALGYDIPESWRWQCLDDLLVFGPTNGFSPKAVDYETPVRSLTLSATTSGRFKGEHSKFITTEVPADSDLWLRDGDILVQRGNTIEYVGVAAVYRGEPNRFVYPDLMMKLRLSSAFDVGFVHLAMSHNGARDFLRARASGTSGSMPKINQTTLKSLPLPIPPLAEQRRIVAKVEQLMALVDALETQLAASRATAANLLSALVAELTGTPHDGKVSVPSASTTGRRGRPRKQP